MSNISTMLQLARLAQTRAYAPYSNFCVGACLRTSNNNFYQGCNVENASYSISLCAEASAISNMVIHGEQDVVEIAIVSSSEDFCAPCGKCRQNLMEFSTAKTFVHLFTPQDKIKTITLSELLPLAFTLEK
jgi:cytidine deaminase